MRRFIPWSYIDGRCFNWLKQGNFYFLGCVASEERCLAVPRAISGCASLSESKILWIHDPEDGFPRLASENFRYTKNNVRQLEKLGLNLQYSELELLVTEERLIELAESALTSGDGNFFIDISVMPKRVFALLLKRMLRDQRCKKLMISYTCPGNKGYTNEPLSYDPLPPDGLPGFNHLGFSDRDTLVVSVGFEPHQLESFVRGYLQASTNRDIKVIIPFPPNGGRFRRNWRALRILTEGQPNNIKKDNISVIAAWDVESVYNRISVWSGESDSLIFAAFGPKPHTVAMASFLSDNVDAGAIVYSQPKVYSPRYSSGIGETYCYVLKGAPFESY